MNCGSLAVWRPTVQQALETFIRRQEQAAGELPWGREVAERLLSFASGGKLLRGCLVCYGYALESNAQPTKTVLDTAVALELTHTALLIHDDLIDRDDLRRGQPALHRQYSQSGTGRTTVDPERFGYDMALCAGDTALFWALGLLRTMPDTHTGMSVGDLFSRVLATVCAGQMEDIRQGLSRQQPARRTIYAIMRAKTASYSVALPLTAGAILAGRPARVQHALHEIGLAAGTIFQVRDDELGLFGTSNKIGKPVGSDIREGKKTLAYYYLWRAASSREKRYLASVFGNELASQADIRAVQKLLRDYNVRARLKGDIDGLKAQAHRRIKRLGTDPAVQAKLRELVAFCAVRQT